MRKKSCQKDWPTFPESFNGIQVNCCKFTRCDNFGISPEDSTQRASSGQNSNANPQHRQVAKHHPLYKTSGSAKFEASIVCKACEKKKKAGNNVTVSSDLKSNYAIYQEYERLSRYLMEPEVKCPNTQCPTYTVEFFEPSIKKRGYTKAGTPRYECKHCKKTFTVGRQSRQQKRPEINIRLFDLLVMHAPLRRIAKHLNISPKTLYDKIDFIHRQCLSFVKERELRLIEGKLKLDRLYLSTDRQVQTTNWTKREDKRTTEMYGISTACLRTGYVFAFNFNFDETINQFEVESLAEEYGDNDKPKHHRVTARVWLESEFSKAITASASSSTDSSISLVEEIENKIEHELSSSNPESSENIDGDIKLPAKGVLVHNEYTMLAHFLLLNKLTQHVGKTRFYMDQDTGMKTAYLGIFKDKIKLGKSDGFLVRALKNNSVDDKRRAVAATNKLIKKITGIERNELSNKQFRDVVNQLIIERLDKLITIKKSTEQWLDYPVATMPESEKLVAAVTDISKYGIEHQANLYRKASLHAVDRFFMNARRAVGLLERSFSSGSNASRNWNGYSAYNPAMLTKMADIYRVYYNYANKNDKGETPAMRLGLAKGPVAIEKILYFGKYE